jgi:hypothetical protein
LIVVFGGGCATRGEDDTEAVGNAEFQKKYLGKMKDVAGHGRTILWN